MVEPRFTNITTLLRELIGQQKKGSGWKDQKRKESEHVMTRDTLMRCYTVVVVGFKRQNTTNNDLRTKLKRMENRLSQESRRH